MFRLGKPKEKKPRALATGRAFTLEQEDMTSGVTMAQLPEVRPPIRTSSTSGVFTSVFLPKSDKAILIAPTSGRSPKLKRAAFSEEQSTDPAQPSPCHASPLASFTSIPENASCPSPRHLPAGAFSYAARTGIDTGPSHDNYHVRPDSNVSFQPQPRPSNGHDFLPKTHADLPNKVCVRIRSRTNLLPSINYSSSEGTARDEISVGRARLDSSQNVFFPSDSSHPPPGSTENRPTIQNTRQSSIDSRPLSSRPPCSPFGVSDKSQHHSVTAEPSPTANAATQETDKAQSPTFGTHDTKH